MMDENPETYRYQIFVWSDRGDLTPDERMGYVCERDIIGEEAARARVASLTATAEPYSHYGYELMTEEVR
jgi:hypothetical protein